MSKRGRPRKVDGDRYESGRLKPQKHSKDAIAPTAMRRAIDYGVKLGADPRLATELGRLSMINGSSYIGGVEILHGLTATDAAVGLKVSEIYGRFAFYHPHECKRNAKSPAYEMGFRGAADSSSESDDEYMERCAAAEKAFRSLPIQAEGFCPHKRAIIERLCVQNESVTYEELRDARALLADLAEHFGMVKASKKKDAPKSLKPKKEPTGISRNIPTANERDREAWLYVAKQMAPSLPDDDALYYREIYRAINARNEFRPKTPVPGLSTLSHLKPLHNRSLLTLPNIGGMAKM